MSKKLLLYIEKALSFFLIIAATVMVLVVVLQIFARYALPWSPGWTEEMARFCFIYMVSFGAGLALKENAYVSVTTLIGKLTFRWKLIMETIILLFISLLMIVMLASSFQLIGIVKLQTSAELQINMAFIYFSMSLMSFFVFLFSMVQIGEKLRLLKENI